MHKKHSFIFLVLVILMGQGSLFMHDMNHTLEEEVSDCLLCTKLDTQEHTLPAGNLLEFTTLNKGEAPLTSYTRHDNSDWPTSLSRAPPLTV
ncbi:MAG: hypothetical protein GKR93_03580 [Gammaproteobacteria bacterium]|nr:hypothetical protein [Gammaproteobacteria bacterium]